MVWQGAYGIGLAVGLLGFSNEYLALMQLMLRARHPRSVQGLGFWIGAEISCSPEI